MTCQNESYTDSRQQMPYVKLDNAFLRLGDIGKTQRPADGFERADWVHVLDCYGIQVNPVLELACTSYPLASEVVKRPGQVTRLLRRLHAHGLVAKIPHSRRWRVSLAGRRTMTTAIKLREAAYPSLFASAT